MLTEKEELLKDVSTVFIAWALEESKDEPFDPYTKDHKDISDQFLIKIITKKLEWAGVDVIIPDYLALILDICAETPADIQMLIIDILANIRNRYKDFHIPKGYVITTQDFVDVFEDQFPVMSIYENVRAEYDHKWDIQKLENRSDFTDNMYDAHDFWDTFKNV